MSDEIELEFGGEPETEALARFGVVCHTEGCENAELGIVVMAVAAHPRVVCGPCARLITDVTALDG